MSTVEVPAGSIVKGDKVMDSFYALKEVLYVEEVAQPTNFVKIFFPNHGLLMVHRDTTVMKEAE